MAAISNVPQLVDKKEAPTLFEDTECYKCGKKCHFARDCFSKTSKPSHKSPTLYSSSVSKGFQPKFKPKLIQSSQYAQTSQGEPKVQKDYKAEYKKMKAKLALLEAIPPTSQSSKPLKSKNKGLNHARNGEWIDITMKKLNILLSMDEDSYWQNYLKYININLKYVKEQRLNLLSKYNKINFDLNKFRDDILALKQVKLEATTFQIENTELTKLNLALQDQLKEERKANEKWLNRSNKVSQCISEQIPNQKKKILSGEQLTESSSKIDFKDNPFVPASLDYDHEMVPKSKYWVERLNPDSKLLNFNTRRLLVPKSEVVNECLQLTKAPSDPESSKESGSEPQTPLPPLKILHRASPSFEVMTLTYQDHSPTERSGLGTMKHTKPKTQESSNKNVSGLVIVFDLELVTSSVPTKVKGRVLAESFHTSESSIRGGSTTCGSNVHSTTDHNDFEHFKRETHQEAYLVPGQWMLKEYDWCQELSTQICRATRTISLISINHEIYTLVIVDEYSRYTWVYFLKKKSQAAEMIMSFVKMVENQNDVKVNQIRTNNGTEFRNSKLESFCDEKIISYNFSSPFTPEQNGVAERKNRTLIETARTMLNGSVLSKHF
ncbi:retrovirus-related pol polyprotein from transposon TNT 1-94 [Tanacetum coccineum]